LKILVIAAHPDDEVLGVGGTILRHRALKDTIYVCIVTKTYEPEWSKVYMANKLEEQKKVDNLLGVKKRFNLDLPTVKLNTLGSGELNRKITEVIDAVCPDVVYTHFSNDLNYDHKLIFQACLVATRPPKKIKLLCFETLSETEWGSFPFIPNVWIDISKFLDKKIRAFRIYKSEVKKFSHPRSIEGIRVLAKKRGCEVCSKAAEAFILIRDTLR